MPSIRLSNGILKYKTHPLFLGIKRIDKEISAKNLLLLKAFLDKHHVTFGLIAGTLLGAVREKDFISHDEDIDLFFLDEQRQELLDLLPELILEGFEVARYDRRGLLSIIREGEYIDLYFFAPLCEGVRHCCGWCIPEELLLMTKEFDFKGAKYNVPADVEGFLIYEYGMDWSTPIEWADYEMPKWKRKFNEWKEIIKEILPDILFYPIAQRTEKKVLRKYMGNMERYNLFRAKSLKLPI